MKKIINISSILFICFVAQKSYCQNRGENHVNELCCQFLKDFFGSSAQRDKAIYLAGTLDTLNGSERMLRNYLLKNKLPYQKAGTQHTNSTKIPNCAVKSVSVVEDDRKFDSLATLFALSTEYEALKEVYGDTLKLPEKPSVSYIPLEIGRPAISKNYAVISSKVSSNISYFLYKYINKRWTMIQLLYDPR